MGNHPEEWKFWGSIDNVISQMTHNCQKGVDEGIYGNKEVG
mgnify:CR=1 FL=1